MVNVTVETTSLMLDWRHTLRHEESETLRWEESDWRLDTSIRDVVNKCENWYIETRVTRNCNIIGTLFY